MSRRSTPQSIVDDRAFPVRMLVNVPEFGLGRLSNAMHDWLNAELGRGNYAWHAAGRVAVRDSIAFYFRSPHAAAAFSQAFPSLELTDGTMARWYSSPDVPFGREEDEAQVCNLYSQTTAQEAMRRLFKGVSLIDKLGNLEPGSVYPDQFAPIVRHEGGALELVRARWGMPSPEEKLPASGRDKGVTNVRNLSSPHWRRWLGPAHRCLVPVTSFAEPVPGGNQWFAPAIEGTPMFFAGIEVRGWRSIRKVKDGETADDLFGFLTCAPNAEVGKVHPKAMPVILTEPQEWEAWLSAPFEIAAKLQRPLPDGSLRVIDGPI